MTAGMRYRQWRWRWESVEGKGKYLTYSWAGAAVESVTWHGASCCGRCGRGVSRLTWRGGVAAGGGSVRGACWHIVRQRCVANRRVWRIVAASPQHAALFPRWRNAPSLTYNAIGQKEEERGSICDVRAVTGGGANLYEGEA